jgi:hypothetical protein
MSKTHFLYFKNTLFYDIIVILKGSIICGFLKEKKKKIRKKLI